jgi:hypothetical protein
MDGQTKAAIAVCALNRVFGCMRRFFDAADAERECADDLDGSVAKAPWT